VALLLPCGLLPACVSCGGPLVRRRWLGGCCAPAGCAAVPEPAADADEDDGDEAEEEEDEDEEGPVSPGVSPGVSLLLLPRVRLLLSPGRRCMHGSRVSGGGWGTNAASQTRN
jgi:hypothetical protein